MFGGYRVARFGVRQLASCYGVVRWPIVYSPQTCCGLLTPTWPQHHCRSVYEEVRLAVFAHSLRPSHPLHCLLALRLRSHYGHFFFSNSLPRFPQQTRLNSYFPSISKEATLKTRRRKETMWFFKSSKSSSKSSATQHSTSIPTRSQYASYSMPNLLEVPYAPAKAFEKRGVPIISRRNPLPKVQVSRDVPLVAGPTSVSRRKAMYRDEYWEPTKRCRSCEGDNVIDPSQIGKYVACKNVYVGQPCPGYFHVTHRDALKAKKSLELKQSFDFSCPGDDRGELPKKYRTPRERWPAHYY